MKPICVLLLFLAWLPLFAEEAPPVRSEHTEVQLVSEVTEIQPGTPFWVALRMKMDPGWHTYWVNPGDAGGVTTVDWHLPAGFSVGPIQWPAPKLYVQEGLMNYVYEGEVFLLMKVTPPSDLKPGTDVTLQGKVSWIECDDKMCLARGGEVRLTLPVGETTPEWNPRWHPAFEATRAAAPRTLPDVWKAEAWLEGNQYYLKLTPLSDKATKPEGLYFYSEDGQIEPSAEQKAEYGADGSVILGLQRSAFFTEKAEHLIGVVTSKDGWMKGDDLKALLVDVPLIYGKPAGEAGLSANGGSSSNLVALLGLALLGGFILNLMPCVFPVLGIKVMGFVNQAGEERGKVVLHGIVFTLGVMISFWILSGVLIALRAGGEELGWGFQLQSSGFVLGLTIVLLVFGLSLSGVFDLGYSAVGVGSRLAGRSGLSGSFFSGVLATVVATPCAAPFLAPALGGALTLPPVESIVVFTFIALGLSLPYLLLSAFPSLIRLLPRPGAWMETFKQLMAFPLYATVAYLMWILAGLVEAEQLLNIFLGLVLIAMACWIYGRYVTPASRKKAFGWTATILLLVAGVWLGYYTPRKIEWEKWSPGYAEKLRDEGRVVYVDFTARWCATCQVNKRVVFGSDEVNDYIRRHKVVLLKADWTNHDEEITKALASFGRSAIPFNLVYGPGVEEPIELSELLTPGMVLEALQRAQ